jgi:hypothetical protein
MCFPENKHTYGAEPPWAVPPICSPPYAPGAIDPWRCIEEDHWRTMSDAVQANSAFTATDIAAGFAEIVAEYHATLGHQVTDLRG